LSIGFLPFTRQLRGGLALIAILLTASSCAVRRTTRVPAAQVPPPALEASTNDLVGRINAQSAAIRTLNLTVDLAPTAGSVYSGVIKEYRDVKGFILAERPAMIRMIGQAPVVRTNIFDMVSDGNEFRLYIPSRQQFIVGKTTFHRPVKNALESLRPQHILEALLIPPIDPSREACYREEENRRGRRDYVINVLETPHQGDGVKTVELALKRKIWFDRSTLDITRLELYGPEGGLVENVEYSDYRDFQGLRYPMRIELERPVEDYSLAITILDGPKFNQPITPEKFELRKPADAQLVELGEERHSEEGTEEEAARGY
jgi:outer membrane lipoprotein-sorting protein